METKPLSEPARRRARVCPQCGRQSVSRSRRRGIAEHLISLAGIYPYRCEKCEHRFLSRSQHSDSQRRPTHLSRWAQCPRCSSMEIDRISEGKVPRRWSNLLWRWVHVPAYRCPECRNHFFDWRPRKREAVKHS